MASNAFAAGSNLFASELYMEYKKTNEGNFVISPIAVELIMAMVRLGAKKFAAEEIQEALHLPKTDQELKSSIDETLKSLKLADLNVVFANKIYVQEKLVVKDHFKHIARNLFRSDIEKISFEDNEKAAEEINTWVKLQTEEIEDLVDPSVINANTISVLINALYFQALWAKTFKKESSKVGDFHDKADHTVSIETMSKRDTYPYCENTTLKAGFLKIPLKNRAASFVIVLPDAIDGLEALENQPNIFLKQEYADSDINLTLPIFSIASSVPLLEILKTLGVERLFTPDADLSGIAGQPGEMFVDDVVQKAVLSICEKGVEADGSRDYGHNRQRAGEPKDINVDHPFIFFIEVNDTVLLAGRVLDPTE